MAFWGIQGPVLHKPKNREMGGRRKHYKCQESVRLELLQLLSVCPEEQGYSAMGKRSETSKPGGERHKEMSQEAQQVCEEISVPGLMNWLEENVSAGLCHPH
ncbi:uncharacterized [Tachysurus ichikawai]